jgi:hypothetical protein
MNTITNHDRVSAHLYRYMHVRYDIEFNAPFDLTQDGIAMKVGISRGHSNILIKRMMENNELIVGAATIKGSNRPVKRKIYVLSEYGKNLFRQRVKELTAQGENIDDLMRGLDRYKFEDIRRNIGDRLDDLGCVAVLRVKVRKDDAPMESPFLPIRSGYAVMQDTTRETLLSGCTDEDLRAWHSKAADWCMDHGVPATERLFHLIGSGRDREAIRILKGNG